ncbi:hypothetical protein Patl1_10095 [Pistacia atlantica]|uniref:Uncharacterized protein n=1 Tax=Pistacia atlantica TaxID=434234 RepID=A0ACC1A7L0_9ROSI|nr:hypothetical protein Patl1_10095 [Pistacia atlantica]
MWESFQEPSDKLLTNMKLTLNVRTGEKVRLISWKSPSDPSTGSFSSGLHISDIPEIFCWNGTRPYSRTGPWNGRIFIGVEGMSSVYLNGFKLGVDDQEGTFYFSFSFPKNPLSYYFLNSQGKLVEALKVEGKDDWIINTSYLGTECDVYGKCGAYGSCDSKRKPICSCLRGFEPKNKEEWNRGNWTSGCVRRKLLQCERINKTGEVGKADGFVKMPMMKVPDFAEMSSALENECRDGCLNNCSCIACAYDVGIGCMTWRENLLDTQKFSSDGTNLYIRLAHSELDKKDLTVIILVPLIVGMVTIAICTFFSWRWTAKRKAMKSKRKAWKLWNENNIVNLIDPVISAPCFELEIIRCINVGLLCVQEFVKDRPSMSTVISMLSSEIVDLPTPKRPAFTETQNAFDTESSRQRQNCSVNNVTVSLIQGR